jgi:hypothetical protein
MSVLPGTRGPRRGSVLIVALLFIILCSALAAAIAAFSGVNVQVGSNQQKLNNTRACAESGLEVTRYWLSQVAFTGTTPASERFTTLATNLQSVLTAAGITNIVPICDATTIALRGSATPNVPVPLNSSKHQSFSAVLTNVDVDTIRLAVTGRNGNLTRTIQTDFVFGKRPNNVFDYGVATKGQLQLSGNIDMEGANIAIESNAYIETDYSPALSIIGNSEIAGNVKITNPAGSVFLQGGQAGIGGVYGQAAAQPPYTEYGYPQTEFPEMVPSIFAQYVTHDLDPNTNTSASLVLENIRIPAGRNPNFTGGVTLRGVVWIEAPNVVKFSGSTTVCAVIVGNGNPTDYSGANSITFSGSLASLPVSALPEELQFDGIRNETGTFLMAPGFAADFEGPFTTVSGAIAANGITFGGSAGGTIYGSLLNYSPNPMDCSGHNDLYFNRSGLTEVPAGFMPQVVLRYNPSSYSEATL